MTASPRRPSPFSHGKESPALSARRILPALALLPVLALAACLSPPSTFFALRSVPGTPVAPTASLPRVIEVRRVSLAGYLDRSEIVRANPGVQLTLATNDRWAAPLGDMVGRVLSDDLTQRLPGATVFSEAGAISADADATVEVDILRMDGDGQGQIAVVAQVAIEQGHARVPTVTRSFRFTVTPASASTADLVAAMSQGLGELADGIAPLLAQPGPTVLR